MVKRALLSLLFLTLPVFLGRAQSLSVAAGTTIHTRLTRTISTKLNFQGEAFVTKVSEPFVENGREIIPVGAQLSGRISRLQRPGRIRGVGAMQLVVDKITFPDGRSYPFAATLIAAYGAEGATVSSEEGIIRGPGSKLKDIKEVGMGMGGGGFLGTLIGGFHGAVVGGAIGGAAGLIDVLAKRGPDLSLPTGTELNYQLTRELVVAPTLSPPASRAYSGN